MPDSVYPHVKILATRYGLPQDKLQEIESRYKLGHDLLDCTIRLAFSSTVGSAVDALNTVRERIRARSLVKQSETAHVSEKDRGLIGSGGAACAGEQASLTDRGERG